MTNTLSAKTDLTLTTIRSHADAYAVAEAMNDQMEDGDVARMSTYEFERSQDGYMKVRRSGGFQVFERDVLHRAEVHMTTCELADVVLWPNRKELNDFINTYCTPKAHAKADEAEMHRLCSEIEEVLSAVLPTATEEKEPMPETNTSTLDVLDPGDWHPEVTDDWQANGGHCTCKECGSPIGDDGSCECSPLPEEDTSF